MKFDYRIFSENGKDILAEGYTKHAFVDRNGRLLRPPEFIIKIIAKNYDSV
jgi:acyl-CoA thioester hydrolase